MVLSEFIKMLAQLLGDKIAVTMEIPNVIHEHRLTIRFINFFNLGII